MSQNPTPAQLRAILQYAGNRLGIAPEQLMQAVNGGNWEAIAGKLSPENAAKLEAMMQDRGKAEELLRSPAVKRLIEQWTHSQS